MVRLCLFYQGLSFQNSVNLSIYFSRFSLITLIGQCRNLYRYKRSILSLTDSELIPIPVHGSIDQNLSKLKTRFHQTKSQ